MSLFSLKPFLPYHLVDKWLFELQRKFELLMQEVISLDNGLRQAVFPVRDTELFKSYL